MPRVRSKTARTKRAPKAAKQPLPKEAISLTDWKCWPLVSSNETMVWPESETSFWRQSAEPQADARRSEVGGRRRERVVPSTKAPIPQAIFMCKAQGKFLDKAREAIERMQLLAAQVQQSPAGASPTEAYREEFDTLVSFLEKLSETEIDGTKLFQNANTIVPLESDNRLIMSGIDLSAEIFQAVVRVRITTPEDATQALPALQKGLRFITINREILSSNVGRLFFARDRLDEVKRSLQAA